AVPIPRASPLGFGADQALLSGTFGGAEVEIALIVAIGPKDVIACSRGGDQCPHPGAIIVAKLTRRLEDRFEGFQSRTIGKDRAIGEVGDRAAAADILVNLAKNAAAGLGEGRVGEEEPGEEERRRPGL